MLKHPLAKKEWENTARLRLFFSFIFLTGALILHKSMKEHQKGYLFSLQDNMGPYRTGGGWAYRYADAIFMGKIYMIGAFMLPIALIGIVLLVVNLFRNDLNGSKRRWIGKFSYGCPERFEIKYMVGVATFTVPFFLFGIAGFLMHFRHRKWINYLYRYSGYGEIQIKQDSLGALFLWISIMWMIMVAIYSFLMLIQIAMGASIQTAIIGVVIWIVPAFSRYVIPDSIKFIPGIGRKTTPIWTMRFFILGHPEHAINRIEAEAQYLEQRWMYYRFFEYQYIGIRIVILLGIITISTILASHLAKPHKMGKKKVAK